MQLPLRLGQFILEREIGAGGMGVVYQAVDTTLDRPVAIKVLNPELAHDPDIVRRFRAEAKAQANLNHPNIAVLHAFAEQDGRCLIVMELLEGDPFDELLAQRGRLPWQNAVALAQQTLQGLGFAHSRGVVHRDIKPGNLMLTSTGTVKIMDFGIAKALRDVTKAAPSALMGTPHYMSPEQILGQPLDRRCDIYCLGVTLYQLLSGVLPFSEKSDFQVMTAHVNTPPPPLAKVAPDVPEAVVRCVERALEKNPDSRFQNAEEFHHALEAAKQPIVERKTIKEEPEPKIRPETVAQTTPVPPQKPGLPFGRWQIVAIAVFVLMLGIATIKLWPTRQQPPDPGQTTNDGQSQKPDTAENPQASTEQPRQTTPVSASTQPQPSLTKAKPSPPPQSAPASTVPASMASLLLKTDADCDAKVNGGNEVKHLKAGETTEVYVDPGQAFVEYCTDMHFWVRQKKVMATAGLQQIVDIHIRADLDESKADDLFSDVVRSGDASKCGTIRQLWQAALNESSDSSQVARVREKLNDGKGITCDALDRFMEGGCSSNGSSENIVSGGNTDAKKGPLNSCNAP
jgi:serine/threonine protein kinase